MANLIIQSGRYKKDFLLAYTVAPFLVRDDDDMFMRDADGNYLVWDEQQGRPVAMTPGEQASPCETMELDGAHVVDGVACKTAFARLREHLRATRPNGSRR